jgi:hypothetical protein
MTPILLDLLLLGGVVFLLSGVGIDEGYFKGSSYCPALMRGRSTLIQYDANLFFYVKGKMATYCDFEDSYWRFFMDAWIRGVLTGTDTWLLIACEFWWAFVFEEFVRVVVTPIIAWVYAIVATAVNSLEQKIELFISQEEDQAAHPISKFLDKTKEVVDFLSLAHNMELDASLAKVPPQTYPRRRPYKDWVENCGYWTERTTRQLSRYRAQALSACRFVLRGTLVVALALRVLCKLVGGSGFVLVARLVGNGELIEQHKTWFTEGTGIVPETAGYYSDWLVTLLAGQLLGSNVFRGAGMFTLVGSSFVSDSRAALAGVLLRLFLGLVFLLIPPFLCYRFLSRQREQYKVAFKEYKKEALHGMDRNNPMKDWKACKFSVAE